MDVLLFIASVGSFCCLTLGVYVLSKDYRKKLNRLFFLMSISLAGFIFISNICYAADSIEVLMTRYEISSFFFSTYFAFNLHFNLLFTQHRLHWWHLILLYFPAPVVILSTFMDQSLFSRFVSNGGTWDFVPAYSSFGLYFYLSYVTAYMLFSIILMEVYRRKTDLNKVKKQASIINWAYLLTMTLGSMFAFVLPFFGIYSFSQVGPNTYFIYYLAIFYSVFRFQFPDLSPSIMTDEIIENIAEMIMLLGKDFNIRMCNSRSLDILGISPEGLKGKSFFSLYGDDNKSNSAVAEYLESGKKSQLMRINYKNNGEYVLTDTSISQIYDRFTDLVGYLVISKQNNGKFQIQRAYKITDREFEVIDLILSGLSNKLIGENLGISERTVEAHCLHIYTKLGINDRVELFKFANEFNILPKKELPAI